MNYIILNKIKFLLLFVLLLPGANSCKQAIKLELKADKTLEAGLISITPPKELQGEKYVSLVDENSGERISAQVMAGKLYFSLDKTLETGAQRTYVATVLNKSENRYHLVQDADKIVLMDGTTPMMTYWHARQCPKHGEPDHYCRSGFIHPLYTPAGRILTDDFPQVHHTHQHGMFLAFVNTTFRDRKIDFWNQYFKTGNVAHVAVEDTMSGPLFAAFRARLEHIVLDTVTGTNTRVLDEIWRVKAYKSDGMYVVDFESELRAAGTDSLTLNEYHYGGFGIRANPQWWDINYKEPKDSLVNFLGAGQGGFLTSEGKTRIEGNHSRPDWVAMHGKLENEPAGLVAMNHPDNFRSPQPVRLHPSMPYFCFTPPVLGAFSIKPGDTYISRYRLLLFDGKINRDKIEAEWAAYQGTKH